MTDTATDTSERAVGEANSTRLTRRDLLRALGIGGGAVISGAGLAAAQDATPPVQPSIDDVEFGYRRAGGPSVSDRTFELEADVDAIFAFVRDQVRYEAYAGALRGPLGTLWGLAGNSVDQAQLLAAMLNEAKITTRFVIGALDEVAASALLASSEMSVDSAAEHAAEANASTLNQELGTIDSLTPEQHAIAEVMAERAGHAIEGAKVQFTRTVSTIMTALADVGISIPAQTSVQAGSEQSRHVWVQYASGAEWVDLDPTMPEAAPGQSFATVDSMADAIAPDQFHMVTLRIMAEKVVGGTATPTELLAYTAESQNLVGKSITLLHLQPGSLKGLGAVIENTLEGTIQYIPHLAIGPSDVFPASDRVTLVTSDDSGAFGASLGSDGDTLSEWLEVEVSSPDLPARREVRQIFDRVSPDLRSASSFDPASVPPAALTDLGGATGEVYLPLVALWSLVPTVGSVPLSYFEQDFSVLDLYLNLSLPAFSYSVARQGLALHLEDVGSPRVTVNRPCLTAFTMRPTAFVDGTLQVEQGLDLIVQGLAATHWPSASDSQPPASVAAGVLSHIAERAALGQFGPAEERFGAAPKSVGELFEAAEQQSIEVLALLPSVPVPSHISMSPAARPRVEQALADGYIVVLPELPVTVDGVARTGWWQIDPITGETFDRTEDGRGMTTLEYAQTMRVSVYNAEVYQRLALCGLYVTFMVAGITLFLTLAGAAGVAAAGGQTNLAIAAIVAGAGGSAWLFGGAAAATVLGGTC